MAACSRRSIHRPDCLLFFRIVDGVSEVDDGDIPLSCSLGFIGEHRGECTTACESCSCSGYALPNDGNGDRPDGDAGERTDDNPGDRTAGNPGVLYSSRWDSSTSIPSIAFFESGDIMSSECSCHGLSRRSQVPMLYARAGRPKLPSVRARPSVLVRPRLSGLVCSCSTVRARLLVPLFSGACRGNRGICDPYLKVDRGLPEIPFTPHISNDLIRNDPIWILPVNIG